MIFSCKVWKIWCSKQALNAMYKYNEAHMVGCDLHLTLPNGQISKVDTLPRVALVFLSFSEWSLSKTEVRNAQRCLIQV